jgi:hypothetical protein
MLRFFLIFSFIFGTLFFLLYLIRMSQGGDVFPVFIFASLTSIIVTAFIHCTSDKIGAVVSKLIYGRHGATTRLRKRLVAELAKAESKNKHGKFGEADQILDEILIQDPQFPEALILKAKMAWVGLKDSETAKSCLKKLMETTDPKGSQFHWASNFYDEILGLEKLKE